MIIKSVKNEKIKLIRRLMKDKDYIFLDSPKLIEEAIKAKCEIKYFITEENKQEKFKKIFDYVNMCKSEIIQVSDSIFKTLSNTIWSQGILGIISRKERALVPPSGNYLILDELQDPGNVGTLIRSGVGVGFEDIYLLNCVNISNDKVVRSTMGAIFKARVYELSRKNFIDFYKSFENKNLIIADMVGEDIFTTKVSTPCGLVIGNEGNGVSKEIRALTNKVVSIPMKNNLESLNAGVAGSIIMFKICNQ